LESFTAIAFLLVPSLMAIPVAFRRASRSPQDCSSTASQIWRSITVVLVANLVGSVIFGAYLAVNILCCSAEPSYWMMPLVFAPLEYWSKFGSAIGAYAVIVAIGIVAIRKYTGTCDGDAGSA